MLWNKSLFLSGIDVFNRQCNKISEHVTLASHCCFSVLKSKRITYSDCCYFRQVIISRLLGGALRLNSYSVSCSGPVAFVIALVTLRYWREVLENVM